MRVGSTLAEPFRIHGTVPRAGEQSHARIAELLGEVGLDRSVTELYPHQLSGGQCQRIGFARALTLNPRLLVADEPVFALAVSIRAQILNLMKRDLHGLTYVLISHDLAVVRYLADRIGVMYLGKLVEVGPSEKIYRHPTHPYTAGLLESIPLADPEDERATPRFVVPGELPSAIDPPSGCRFRTRCARAQDLCAQEEPTLRGPIRAEVVRSRQGLDRGSRAPVRCSATAGLGGRDARQFHSPPCRRLRGGIFYCTRARRCLVGLRAHSPAESVRPQLGTAPVVAGARSSNLRWEATCRNPSLRWSLWLAALRIFLAIQQSSSPTRTTT